MSYTPTTWVEKVTKVGPTNLNKLENGVAAALPKAAGSADPLTGTLYFGLAADTNLYRSAAGALRTDGLMSVGQALTVGFFGSSTRAAVAMNSDTTDPATIAFAGSVYVKNGALFYRGTSGTITQLAVA